MIEFIIEGLASFLGGYFTEQAVQKILTVKKLFFLIFAVIMGSGLIMQIIYGFTIESLLIYLIASISTAVLLCLLVILFKQKKKEFSSSRVRTPFIRH